MKAIVVSMIIGFSFFGQTTKAQAVNPSHGIGRVDEDHEKSPEYVARTPYTLEWAADRRRNLYGKSNPLKVDSYLAGIHVHDAATGKIIATVGKSELNGSLKVPVAGKHYCMVFCTGAVNLSYVEDKAVLEAAARRGELKDGVTVATAGENGLRARRERIHAAKAEMLAKIEEKKLPPVIVGELKLAAEKAAQLASDENDFYRRFAALLDGFNSSGGKPSTEIVPSKWNGTGLPPGMQRK